MVAANDSTTVAMSSSGATNARSSSASTANTTTSTIGMITVRSRSEVVRVSSCSAVDPPTKASAPSTACTDSRSRSTVAMASSESAASDSVALMRTSPSAVPVISASATPRTPSVAASTSSAREASAITTAGEPEPPGKCRDSTSCPATDSTSFRKMSDSAVPLAFSCGTNAAPTSNTSDVTSHTARGRLSTRLAMRPQRPPDSGGAEPSIGRNGQYAARPMSASTAGRKVMDASTDDTMPMVATGPSPLFDSRSLNSRQSRPRMTVPADATTGSIVARHAVRIAATLSPVVRSSSR